MILYHGSNIEIEQINLDVCKPYKDFGRGFYTTENEEQAKKTAKRTARLFGGKPLVTVFSCNYSELNDANIKTFDSPSNDWALFVINNRNKYFTDIYDLNCNLDNKYDMVVGPVANDDIRLLFNLFEDNILTIDELKKRLEYKELSTQISFHTNKSVNLLVKMKTYSL